MKTGKQMSTILSAFFAFVCMMIIPQLNRAQDGINYQAVARNSSGDVMQNKTIDVRLTVLDATSSQVFQETHNGVSTNDYGLFTLVLGSQNTSNFNTIDWHNGGHELQVEIDNGNGFTNMGTQALQNVPYSLHADMALGEVNNVSTGGVADGQVLKWSATNNEWQVANDNTGGSGGVNTGATIDGDGTTNSPLQIAQQGATSGQVLEWDGNTWTPVSINTGGDNWGSQVAQTGTAIAGDGTAGNELDIAQQGATNGDVLKWNGSSWAPASDNTGGSGGVNTDATIDGDGNNTPLSIAQQGASQGEVLEWDGSSWTPTSISGGSSPWSTSSGHVYRSSGNVGIGTSSPSGALHITAASTNVANGIRMTSSQNQSEDWYQYLDGNDNYVIRDDGSDKFIIENSSGNVGIGTPSPAQNLHISGNGSFSDAVAILDAPFGQSSILKFRAGGSLKGSVGYSDQSGQEYVYLYQGSNALIAKNGEVTIGSNNAPDNELSVDGSADLTGNVGIGTSSPQAPLDIAGGNWNLSTGEGDVRIGGPDNRLKISMSTGGSGAGHARINAFGASSADPDIRLGAHAKDVLRVDSSYVSINGNNLSPGPIPEELHVVQRHNIQNGNNNIAVLLEKGPSYPSGVSNNWGIGVGQSTNTFEFFYNGNNKAAIKSYNGAYVQISDRNMKESIEAPGSVLGKVMKLTPKRYYYKSNQERDEKSYGFIAQEVEKLFPGFVSEMEDDLKGIAYDNFGVLAIQAIQEQQQQIDELKEKNQELRQKADEVDELKQRVRQLEEMVQK